MATDAEPTAHAHRRRRSEFAAVSPLVRRAAPFVLIAALFLGTRLTLLRRFPPFLDESLYATWAMRVHDSVNDRFVALAYGKLPLLSWLGAGLVSLGADPLDAVRLVSITAGVVSLLFAGLLAARLGGTSSGLLAAGFYCLLPLAFVHDVIGVMEPLVSALLVAALYLQMRLAERSEWATAFLLGFVLGAGLLTKETGEIALLLLPASLLLFDWRPEARLRRLASWLSRAVTATVVAGLAYLILSLSELWDDYPKARESLGTFRSFGDGLAHPLRWIQAEWPAYRTVWLGYTTVPVAFVVVAGIVYALRRHGRLASLYVVWLVAPLAVDFLFLPNPFARYIVPMAPLLSVFAGYGLLCASRSIASYVRRPQRVAVVTAALGVVALSSAAVFDGQVVAQPATAAYPGSSREEYATGWAAGTGWRELVAELRRRAAHDHLVVTWYEGVSEALALLVGNDPNIEVVRGQPGDNGPEASADYVVMNGTPLPAEHGLGSVRPVWTFQRPGGGVPIVLYRRGVMWADHFYATPDELRLGLGVSDHEFDRFIASHPKIRAWYMAESSRD